MMLHTQNALEVLVEFGDNHLIVVTLETYFFSKSTWQYIIDPFLVVGYGQRLKWWSRFLDYMFGMGMVLIIQRIICDQEFMQFNASILLSLLHTLSEKIW